VTTQYIDPASSTSHTREERSRLTAELFESAAETRDETRRRDYLEAIVLENRRVAQALAQRFAGRGVDVDDLTQVAYEGLLKAAERFDPEMGRDFLSFAVPTIRGELQRYFRDSGWMVRPTRRVQETQWRVAQTEAELSQRLGRTATAQEIVEELDLSPEEYAEAASANGCFQPTSLDQPASAGEAGQNLGELLEDEDRGLAASEARVTLAPVVRRLSERDRRVLYLRYFEDQGQKEIGQDIGVTQTQVSRILDRILTQLRDELAPDDQDFPTPPTAA
jgi:RNA polymerase sigma-B factor